MSRVMDVIYYFETPKPLTDCISNCGVRASGEPAAASLAAHRIARLEGSLWLRCTGPGSAAAGSMH